jgi:hypothetical protein
MRLLFRRAGHRVSVDKGQTSERPEGICRLVQPARSSIPVGHSDY